MSATMTFNFGDVTYTVTENKRFDENPYFLVKSDTDGLFSRGSFLARAASWEVALELVLKDRGITQE